MEKRAVIMGATSGIGKQTALLLAQRGWKVGIAGRREELLQSIEADTEGITCHKQIDITKDNAPRLLQELIDTLGGMDPYLNSSVMGWQNNGLEPGRELQTAETNCTGFVRMLTAAFNYFAGQGSGHIACISSIAGTRGLGAAPAYSSTKRFQNQYLECLTQLARMRQLHIAITDIRPGFVKTDLILGHDYPLQLRPDKVAKSIVRAIEHRKKVVIIDWRYRILVFFWQLIPRWLWIRMSIAPRDVKS